MAKRMDISCLLFTVPTSLERETSASQSLHRVSGTRRRVPCSAEMDKMRRYTCLDGAIFRPQPTLRANLGCRAGSVCKAPGQSAKHRVRGYPGLGAPPLHGLPDCPPPTPQEVTT